MSLNKLDNKHNSIQEMRNTFDTFEIPNIWRHYFKKVLPITMCVRTCFWVKSLTLLFKVTVAIWSMWTAFAYKGKSNDNNTSFDRRTKLEILYIVKSTFIWSHPTLFTHYFVRPWIKFTSRCCFKSIKNKTKYILTNAFTRPWGNSFGVFWHTEPSSSVQAEPLHVLCQSVPGLMSLCRQVAWAGQGPSIQSEVVVFK